MSFEVRPEYLDIDNDEYFFGSGKVPQFNCSGSTLGELFDLVDFVVDFVEPAGYLDAAKTVQGAETSLVVNYAMSPFLRHRLVDLLQVATWAVEHGRRVEWC